jgi:hypothetical protein
MWSETEMYLAKMDGNACLSNIEKWSFRFERKKSVYKSKEVKTVYTLNDFNKSQFCEVNWSNFY